MTLDWKRPIRSFRRCISFVLVIFSLITFQSLSFADVKQETVEDYREQGVKEQQDGHLDQALSYFLKAIALDPHHHVVLNDIGVVYEEMGDLDLAEQFYLASLKSSPDYLPPYSNLGYLYKKKQNFIQAIEHFQKRVEYGNPEDPWTAKAQEELYKVYDLIPSLKKKMLADSAQSFNQELSKKILKKELIKSDKKYRKGKILFKQEKYLEAYEEFDAALKLTPANPKIMKARNQALLEHKRQRIDHQIDLTQELLKKDKPSSAENEFRKILSIVPSEPE